MGYSVSAAFAILVLSSLISITYVYTSADYALNSVVDAHNSKLTRDYNKLNSEIEIVYIKATQQGATYDLEIKIFNSGDVELSTQKMSFVINGSLKAPDFYDKDFLLPENNLTVIFYNISGGGTGRVRITTEHGSSAYSTYEVV